MISAVVSARRAGLDRIKSGFTSRFANRLPIFGASRLPRSRGRTRSAEARHFVLALRGFEARSWGTLRCGSIYSKPRARAQEAWFFAYQRATSAPSTKMRRRSRLLKKLSRSGQRDHEKVAVRNGDRSVVPG